MVEARHRRRRRSLSRSGTTRRTRRSPRRWRPRSTGWRSCARTSRTRRTTPRGSTSSRRRPRSRTRPTPDLMTTFVFRVRNVPAALYKALGGFATNGVNMTKLESYMLDGEFAATQFLCDVDGHPAAACAARWRNCSSSRPRCACWASIRWRHSGCARGTSSRHEV